MISNGTMKDVPQDLTLLIEQSLAEARRELENTGTMQPIIAMRPAEGETRILKLGEAAADIMNSGPGKDILFGALRKTVAMAKVTAVVVLTDGWVGKPTEKQHREFEEVTKFFESDQYTFDEAVRRGYVERAEALLVIAQDERQAVVITQYYLRSHRTIRFEERSIAVVPQDEFKGRQKMFGVRSEADIR